MFNPWKKKFDIAQKKKSNFKTLLLYKLNYYIIN